jgi:hypothetical protein
MTYKRYFPIFLLVISVITLADFFYLGRPLTGIDDGNIFLTYARHVANGEGFVFNTGGEKVEGFTSLLWVLICAAFYKVWTSPEIPLLIFLLLLTTHTVTIVYEEVRKNMESVHSDFAKKYFLLLFIIFLCSVGPSFVAWSILSLMENALWNFLFLSVIVYLLRLFRTGTLKLTSKIFLVTCCVLLLLTRPESIAWNVCFIIMLAVIEWIRHRKPILTVAMFIAVVSTIVALTSFRKQYFGYPLPNTYYAKVSHNRIYNLTRGLDYLVSFSTSFHFFATFLLSVFFISLLIYSKCLIFSSKEVTLRRKLQYVPPFIFIALIIFTGLLLPLITGGDHFAGYRFYQGLLLLFTWGIPGLIWLCNREKDITRPTIISSFTGVGILTFLLMSCNSLLELKRVIKTQIDYEFYLAKEGRQVADHLNHFWDGHKPSVGVIAVGGFSLVYQGETVDLMGLNNTLMGHSKGERIGIKNHAAFNKDVFYQLNPDILLPQPVRDFEDARVRYVELLGQYNFNNIAMKNIFIDSSFRAQYFPIYMTNQSGNHFFSFVSSNYLGVMRQDSNIIMKPVIF